MLLSIPSGPVVLATDGGVWVLVYPCQVLLPIPSSGPFVLATDRGMWVLVYSCRVLLSVPSSRSSAYHFVWPETARHDCDIVGWAETSQFKQINKIYNCPLMLKKDGFNDLTKRDNSYLPSFHQSL